MNVSALNSTSYYISTIQSKPITNNGTAIIEESSRQAQTNNIDNKKNQELASNYTANRENTLNKNSQDNANNTPVYTGEEMLSAINDKPTKNGNSKNLTEEEYKQVEELKARDMEVKTHEQAHIAAGGSYVRGGANYSYQTGPDGKQYAVGGEVSIDTTPIEGDPQATINKAQVIIKAALAPAEPSGQDKAVASQARQMMANARKELMNEKINTSEETSKEVTSNNNSNNTSATTIKNTTQPYNSISTNTLDMAQTNTTINTESNKINTEQLQEKNTTTNSSIEREKTKNYVPTINFQSLKTDIAYVPQINTVANGLSQVFSNAGMSPIKNANALTYVAGSLISTMA